MWQPRSDSSTHSYLLLVSSKPHQDCNSLNPSVPNRSISFSGLRLNVYLGVMHTPKASLVDDTHPCASCAPITCTHTHTHTPHTHAHTDRQTDRQTDRSRMLCKQLHNFLGLLLVEFFLCCKVMSQIENCPFPPCRSSGTLQRVLHHIRQCHHSNQVPGEFIVRFNLQQCPDCRRWFLKLGQHKSQCRKRKDFERTTQRSKVVTSGHPAPSGSNAATLPSQSGTRSFLL